MTGREVVEAVRRVGGRVALEAGDRVTFKAPGPLAALVRLHVDEVRAELRAERWASMTPDELRAAEQAWDREQTRMAREDPPFWQVVAALDAELDACLSPPGDPGNSAGPLELLPKRGAAPHPGTWPGTCNPDAR